MLPRKSSKSSSNKSLMFRNTGAYKVLRYLRACNILLYNFEHTLCFSSFDWKLTKVQRCISEGFSTKPARWMTGLVTKSTSVGKKKCYENIVTYNIYGGRSQLRSKQRCDSIYKRLDFRI